MTNILEFKRPPTGNEGAVDDLVSWLDLLHARAKLTTQKLEGARSVEKVLLYYGDWLRHFWDANGAVRSLWTHLEDFTRAKGREADEDRSDRIVDCMVEVEKTVKGPRPWNSLPNFDRTKHAALTNVAHISANLAEARKMAQLIGRPADVPVERAEP